MARSLPGNRWFALARAGCPALHLPQARDTPKHLTARILSSKTALVGERKYVTARLAAFHAADQPAEAIALGSRTSTKQAQQARPSTANDDRLSANWTENGGGPEIRTPKSVTRSWISSSVQIATHRASWRSIIEYQPFRALVDKPEKSMPTDGRR
jgi:hypothetical protein